MEFPDRPFTELTNPETTMISQPIGNSVFEILNTQ